MKLIMRLAMVIGEQRLAIEQRMLNRLAVGLMAEGVQIVRLIPGGIATMLAIEGERRMALAPRIEVQLKSLPWARRLHVRRAVETLEESPPDALVLLGRDAWEFGLMLADELDRPALLEVWSATQAMQLPRPATHRSMAGVIAVCEGIARVARSRIGADLVSVVPMGAASSQPSREVLADAEVAPAIVILGGSRDVAAYSAMFGGLARVVQQRPGTHFFLELRGPHEHDIWRQAERAGLISSISAFASAAQIHPLLMRCDMLIWPERFGELRSILLEAMAMGLPVVAAADHALEMLIDGTTARLVLRDTKESWWQIVHELLEEPAQAHALGRRGRDHVLANHQSSEQVTRLLEVLTNVAGTESYAFPRPE